MAQFFGAGWYLLAPGEGVPGQPTGAGYTYDGHRLTKEEIAERVAARAEEDAHNMRVAAYRADLADLRSGRTVQRKLPI